MFKKFTLARCSWIFSRSPLIWLWGCSHLFVLVNQIKKIPEPAPSWIFWILKSEPTEYAAWIVNMRTLIRRPLISSSLIIHISKQKATALLPLSSAVFMLSAVYLPVSLLHSSTSAAGGTRIEQQVNQPSLSSALTLPPSVTRVSKQWVLCCCLIYFHP